MDNSKVGVVNSNSSYTIQQLCEIQGCKERVITNFLKRHGYRPAKVAQGYYQVAGFIWNLCIQKEMLDATDDSSQVAADHSDGLPRIYRNRG